MFKQRLDKLEAVLAALVSIPFGSAQPHATAPPVARRLGWRPEFRWYRLAQWAERHGGVRLLKRRSMLPLDIFH
jgi:hypothetical protein